MTEAQQTGMWAYYATEKERASDLGASFELTFSEFAKLTGKKCIFCNNPGRRAITNKCKVSSLHRLDITKQYTPENTIPACHLCQTIRKKLQFSELSATIRICRILKKLKKNVKQ